MNHLEKSEQELMEKNQSLESELQRLRESEIQNAADKASLENEILVAKEKCCHLQEENEKMQTEGEKDKKVLQEKVRGNIIENSCCLIKNSFITKIKKKITLHPQCYLSLHEELKFVSRFTTGLS